MTRHQEQGKDLSEFMGLDASARFAPAEELQE